MTDPNMLLHHLRDASINSAQRNPEKQLQQPPQQQAERFMTWPLEQTASRVAYPAWTPSACALYSHQEFMNAACTS